MNDNWFARLTALIGLVGKVSAMISILMVIAVSLVIGNSIRMSIFSRRDTINIIKLIGATDRFILSLFKRRGTDGDGQCSVVADFISHTGMADRIGSDERGGGV